MMVAPLTLHWNPSGLPQLLLQRQDMLVSLPSELYLLVELTWNTTGRHR